MTNYEPPTEELSDGLDPETKAKSPELKPGTVRPPQGQQTTSTGAGSAVAKGIGIGCGVTALVLGIAALIIISIINSIFQHYTTGLGG